MKHPKILLASLLSASLLLSACGSSSSSKKLTDADITASNSKDLAIAATESTKQAVASNNVPNPFSFKPSASKFDAKGFAQKVVQQNNQAADNFDFGSICTVSGGASVSGGFSDGFSGNASSGNSSITYNKCNMGSGLIINGTVSISYGNTGDFSIKYKDFTVTSDGITQTVDFSMDCKTNSTTGEFSCSTSSTALGLDGRKYTVKDVSVSGNSSSGYTVSAEVVDPDHGIIEISAQNVNFNCNGGSPSTGSITFTAKGKIASVTFSSCTSFTVTVDGVGTSYNWDDI